MFSGGQAAACTTASAARIIWPIRAIAGETIGFGARRLFDDDQGPKYLNTRDAAVPRNPRCFTALTWQNAI